ncbi:putative phospholipid-transporting ATPase IM [Blattella germanica]|nr:putative phospholipid-transporting ATPase IM [Blattella germanica]
MTAVMKKMEDALELEVFEIKDGNGGIEASEVVDPGEEDDDDIGSNSRGRKRKKKKRRKCKRSPSVTTATVTLAEPECDDVASSRRDSEGPGNCTDSRGTSEGTPGSRRPTSLRESLLSVLGKLVVWRRGAARYRNNGNGGGAQNADYFRGFIPTDTERRIRANDRAYNSQFNYASNYIKTSKYSVLTFLPLNLFEQFQRLANFYFLCLLVLQVIPAISSLTPITTAVPLIGVLALTAVKDAYDDFQRHMSDSQVNNRRSKALRDGKLMEEKWAEVQVGDVIRMENDQFVAADVLLLSTSEPNGLCFIETAELDGFPLDNDKVVLRGCILRNTQWCYGVVIFAGKDTKLMQNSGKTKFKRTSIDRLLNFIIIGVYLPWDTLVPTEPLSGATVIALLVFFSYAIVLNTVVPISLYVSVEVIRFAQSFLINWDEKMHYEKTNTSAKARTTTLNEELGQIEYIFSDKTGTLTQNIPPLDFSWNENFEPEFKFYDSTLLDAVKANNHDVHSFFRLLALCHTVMPEERNGKLEYQAQSPDEAALVSAARNFGFVFKERSPNSITIEVCEGLRTLCLAVRDLDEVFFNDWKHRHQEAALSLDSRDDKLDAIYEEIERDMTLIGVTAIEDKLQDGVPQTIANLGLAGIKIWVLTETAINIGYSCQLLTDEMADTFIVDGHTYDDVETQLGKFREAVRNSGVGHGGVPNASTPAPTSVSIVTFSESEYQRGLSIEESDTTGGFALVINGHSLVHALHPQMEKLFLEVSSHCKSVICCRVTPLQKAMVVELIKKNKKAVTLAIGDGANDVSMIKAAHIGVGISGQEGMQAVLASDYSIAQFRFLERLLLVHGRWSYYRMCKFLRYFFYKNFAFTLCHFWFAFFCGFSAQTVFDPMFISVYNLFYTSLPVLALGIFDQDVSDRNSLCYPKLYTPGHSNLLFNKREFLRSALHGFFTSCVLFLIPYGTYKDGVSPKGHVLSDHMLLGSVVATILVIVVTAQAMNEATFWFTTVITVIILMIPVLAWRFYFVDVRPTLSDRVRLKQRLAQLRSRQSQDVLRTPSARRTRRSIRSGYAFAHQEGFGRLITSGKIMRKLPRPNGSDFFFPTFNSHGSGPSNIGQTTTTLDIATNLN